MSAGYLSTCCGAEVDCDGFGTIICAKCGDYTVARRVVKRDLIEWLFKPETGPRPKGEAVFIRRGRSIALEQPGAVRGKPDGWSWGGA
ncbi:MAG: hypothetical protein JWQ97_3723 [Phenylobacterium sp.]|nr:hypothetical protein [Phenylobacterium sp.]